MLIMKTKFDNSRQERIVKTNKHAAGKDVNMRKY